VRLHRGEARGRGAARRGAARCRHHAAAAGDDHGRRDGDRAVPARRARRSAVGAALLRADWRADHPGLRHPAAGAGALRGLRARPEVRQGVGSAPAGGRSMNRPAAGSERQRLMQTASGAADWQRWGTYVSDRAWGTVREDYSADGRAWEYFPHDHARSRAYRWNEDGLAGICDIGQRMCLALALWNGRDPFLKERIFGLTNHGGNRGDDAKEYWWYVDATPTSSWLRWRYHYPQAEVPYAWLREENARRGKADREFELIDTGVFDGGRYWEVAADYAKVSPRDICL